MSDEPMSNDDLVAKREAKVKRLATWGTIFLVWTAMFVILVVQWASSPKKIELCAIEQIDGYLVLKGVRDWRKDIKLAEGHGHDHARLARLAHILGCPNAAQFDALQVDPERPVPPAASCACSCAATIPPPNQE